MRVVEQTRNLKNIIEAKHKHEYDKLNDAKLHRRILLTESYAQ